MDNLGQRCIIVFTDLVNVFGGRMEFDFTDSDLKLVCEQQKLAVKQLGAFCARKLRTRLADISATSNVQELVSGRPHPLKGDRLGEFSLDLHGGVRLVFVPDHDPIPETKDGSTNWMKVTKVLIIYIGDYHD